MTNNSTSSVRHSLTIGWLYPDLMSTYGDRGNIITLQKRCEWRGIKVEVKKISVGDDAKHLKLCSLVMMGGAEDRQQEIVSEDLKKGKDKILKEVIENNIPGIFICGAYQFLGNYYKEANGNIITGLGIFDVHTENTSKNNARLIGNIAVKNFLNDVLIGFENHGGRTYLGKNVKALGTVENGYGNNGEDKTEGAIYKNAIGTYLHGPILPKNPLLADWLIGKALETKYKEQIALEPLDDTLENQARDAIVKTL